MLTNNFQYSINKYCPNPRVIFDIGSRDLDQSIEFRRSYPDSNIFAFEPNPEQKEICETKAKIFNINFFNIALSNKNSTSDFFAVRKDCQNNNIGASALSDFSDEQRLLWHDYNESNNCITTKYVVDTRTLDSFVEENNIKYIDAIWMDVQGSELDILSASVNILKNTKILHTELMFKQLYKNQCFYPEAKHFLEKNNFVEIYTENSYDPKYRDFRYKLEIGMTDSIFINKDYYIE